MNLEHSKKASNRRITLSPQEVTGGRHTPKPSTALPEIRWRLHQGLLSLLPNVLVPPFTGNDHFYLTLQLRGAKGYFMQSARCPSMWGLALLCQLSELGKTERFDQGYARRMGRVCVCRINIQTQEAWVLSPCTCTACYTLPHGRQDWKKKKNKNQNQMPPCHRIPSLGRESSSSITLSF